MNYEHVTFMLSLPRSRSAWMCAFLQPDCTVMHDPLRFCSNLSDLAALIDNAPEGKPVFIADTAAVLFYRGLLARFPGARFFTVTRDADEVAVSLLKAGAFAGPVTYISAERLAQVSEGNHGGVDAWSYADLDKDVVLATIYTGVTGKPVSIDYLRRMVATNVQCNIEQRINTVDPERTRKLMAQADPA